MKIVCVCDHGQVRSVAMAYVLNLKGHTAVAVSEEQFTSDGIDNIDALVEWCDIILHMEESMKDELSSYPGWKGKIAWIGRDEYNNPHHPELIKLCKAKAEEFGL